ESLVNHGRLQAQLIEAKEANLPNHREGLTSEQVKANAQRVVDREGRVADAKALALAEVRNSLAHPVDRSGLTDYPLELAGLAYRASKGDIPWTKLRSTKAGWAADPMFGYADLQIRMPRIVDERADPVDFAFNGPGVTGEVLTVRSDLDRNGVPDLL